MKNLIYILIITLISSCNNSEDIVSNQSKGLSMADAKPNIYNCQLIEKEFVNKGGKMPGFKELYLRCSVQDYFIKFCESNVTKKDLEPYINKGISVEVEVKDGMWDHCSENLAEVQSRMGPYIIIKKIN